MRSRKLGPNAPAVSVVGFGGMPLSLDGRPPERGAIAVLHAALDAGMTLVDTADVYCLNDGDIGHNERLVAKAVREWSGDRDSILVATKGGMTRPGGRWERDGRPEHLRQACDRSLQALGTERIDLYQFHTPDSRIPFGESIGALAALQAEGKIRWIGLSNVSVDQIKEAERQVTVETVQNRLSPFFREALTDGVVDYCAERGIGFLAYSPVGGGRLNKKLPTHQVTLAIAQRLGVSPHAVIQAWVLAKGATVFVIPGARTVEHAVDSTTAAELHLDAADLDALDQAEFSIA